MCCTDVRAQVCAEIVGRCGPLVHANADRPTKMVMVYPLERMEAHRASRTTVFAVAASVVFGAGTPPSRPLPPPTALTQRAMMV